jgi:hypothetical protein
MKKFWKYLLVLLLVLIVIAIAFLFRPVTSKAIKTKNDEPVVDVVLIGGGIMSATLGTYLNELQPTGTSVCTNVLMQLLKKVQTALTMQVLVTLALWK